MWTGDGKPLLTTAVITTTANGIVGEVHNRMPVVVPPDRCAAWLDPGTPADELLRMLAPFPAALMVAADASPLVNNPRYDGPDCLRAG